MKESILTEFVRNDLESLGYTTYAEVCHKGGGSSRCDMYARIEDTNAVNYGYTIVFEAKLTFNLKVIEQANFWKNKANETYIIVPATYKNIKTRKFARDICKMLGIGVMEVNMNNDKYYISVKSAVVKNPKIPTLYKEQKLSIASNSDNKYVTPFKITLNNINNYMINKESIYLVDLVKNIQHHYKGDISAVRAIKFLIDKQVINGYFIIKDKNKLLIKKHGF